MANEQETPGQLMARLRRDSGEVHIDSKLVAFLYELMRDHVSPGVMQEVLSRSLDPSVDYTNGWLAEYARWMAKELIR